MAKQGSLHPVNLSRFQFDRLIELVEQASQLELSQIVGRVQAHLRLATDAHQRNRTINVRLARAMEAAILAVASRWKDLPQHQRNWLAGAMLYFVTKDDDEPDFSSAIGFEDDTEVLNACLRFAKLDELCLKIEDFDHA